MTLTFTVTECTDHLRNSMEKAIDYAEQIGAKDILVVTNGQQELAWRNAWADRLGPEWSASAEVCVRTGKVRVTIEKVLAFNRRQNGGARNREFVEDVGIDERCTFAASWQRPGPTCSSSPATKLTRS
jgi:hypothetical protein